MASAAEPQWIVANREDGQNVGGWHWVERECLGWLKRHASDKLPGTALGDAFAVAAGADAVVITGEATANNRRGKTIFLFELEWTVRWAEGGGAADAAAGTVVFPYIGEDNEDEEWEAKVTCTTATLGRDAKDAAVARFRAGALPALRKAVAACICAMKDAYRAKGSATTATAAAATAPAPPPGVQVQTQQQQQQPKAPAGGQIEMKERFLATTPEELYELLLDPQRMSAVTGGAAFDRKPGGKFSLFSGAVTGEFVELVAGQKIVERWRFASWPAELSSLVTLTFGQQRGDATIQLVQVGVPREDMERTEAGWKENIFERIRLQFGFGGASL